MALVAAVIATALVAGGIWYAAQTGLGPFADPESCTATVEGHTVALSTEQAENASIIAAVAERRSLPARAISIAIATAYQESKLENLDSGDRDSLGLFQQRPSQGWGTPGQITDPYYATDAFYDALVKVDGYQDMEITEAAQEVQRSAFPDAYADHEQDGRTIASAMSGYSEAAFTCVADDPGLAAQPIGEDGLTPRAEAVREDIATSFGQLPLGGFQAGGARSGHMKGSAHYQGLAIDVFFRPVSSGNTRRGWVLAHYLVANAARLDVQHVIFDGRIWTTGTSSSDGWREYDARGVDADTSETTRAVLEHRDHVHVDVA
ncbi:MAG: hypothetical protein H0T17_09400 [Propionibacteriales bacterium]|nr:hypothetical protein [Propionibacteriales bacterium]